MPLQQNQMNFDFFGYLYMGGRGCSVVIDELDIFGLRAILRFIDLGVNRIFDKLFGWSSMSDNCLIRIIKLEDDYRVLSLISCSCRVYVIH